MDLVNKDKKSLTKNENVEDFKGVFDKKSIENLDDINNIHGSEDCNFLDGWSWIIFNPRS